MYTKLSLTQQKLIPHFDATQICGFGHFLSDFIVGLHVYAE